MSPKGLSVVARHSARSRRHEDAAPPAPDRARLEGLFLANLDMIESVVRFVCRRHKVGAPETEEFASDVRLKLVEKDYDILRRFEGRSSLRTYLTVVVGRLYLDFRNHQWGKWRPSAEARRLGPLAMRLERLMSRDGLSFGEACRHLLHRERFEATEDALLDMACRLPVRIRRVMVGESALETTAGSTYADETTLLAERRAAAARIARILRGALAGLPPQDRLILRLRFLEELSVADTARALNIDSKPLYRRVEALLRRLRTALLEAGVNEAEAQDLLTGTLDVRLALLGGSARDAAVT